MDKFLNKNCDSNKGLELLANSRIIKNNMNDIKYDYNNILRQFKLDMHHKIEQFDPFKKRQDYDIYFKNIWYEYLLSNKSNIELMKLYNILGIENLNKINIIEDSNSDNS